MTEKKNSKTRQTDEKRRPTWAKSWDFVFAAVGFSVGLGNVWRFPYLCFKNGGGAFIIPYAIFAFTISAPCLVLDTSLGQRLRRGLLQSWSLCPILKGIGIAQFVMLLNSSVSYPVILAWAVKYLVNSFSANLPWASCNNVWNTPECVTFRNLGNESTQNFSTTNKNLTSAATEYWRYEVLHISKGIDDVGSIQLDLALYLCLVWAGLYFATFKGIGWSAKVVYVTATLPFPLLIAILIRSTMLTGAIEGLKYFLVPDMSRLADLKVWASACSQTLYSNGPGLGVVIALGSFNDRHHNFFRDSMTVVGMNFLTSVLGGIAVFATLGSMAFYQNTTVEQVATSGPGLAFIAYPETLSLFPFPQIWCVLFFVMVLSLGYDSQFVCQETMATVLLDNCRKLREFRYGRELAQGILCLTFFLFGLPLVTEGGVYAFELHSNYSIAGWCWVMIVVFECVAVAWMYGFERYWKEVEEMIGRRKLGRYWMKLCWSYVVPITCSAIAVYYMANISPPSYEDYEYPVWAEYVSHLISVIPTIFIPGYAVYKLVKTWMQGGKLKELFSAPMKIQAQEEELKEFKISCDDV